MDRYEKAFLEITDHLLGKDYYISDPVSGERVIEIIINEIKTRYKAAHESPVEKYRRRHKKCKFCTYCKYVNPLDLTTFSYMECSAKDKIIYSDNTPRFFCSLFTLKKGR